MAHDNRTIGHDFFQQTKYRRSRMPGGYLDWQRKPRPYKEYPDAERISLPTELPDIDLGLWDIVRLRRSAREFTSTPITLQQLAALLWASQGGTQQTPHFELRAAPSAGALYPIETYIAVNTVDSLKKGIYHYNVLEHALEPLRSGQVTEPLARACLDQDWMMFANVIFIWTAMFERCTWKYRQRAFRYISLDAGHIAHAVALAAVALDMGSCPIAAFYDEEVNALVQIDGEQESALYLTAVGRLD